MSNYNIHKNSIFYRGIRDIENINNLIILRNNVPIYLSSKDSAKQYSSNNPLKDLLKNYQKILFYQKLKRLNLKKNALIQKQSN